MKNEIFDAAIVALDSGWSVMPVSREKKPIVKWKAFQTERPNSDLLAEWFADYPGRNLGLITGAISGRFVVESDTEEALEYLISRGIPECPIAQSSQPFKRHFHFAHPEFDVQNSASAIFPGVDVRGDGGYAVLPPSVHKTGVRYEWIVSPSSVALPQAPDWILEAVRKPVFMPQEAPPPSLQMISGASSYATKAFENELENVRGAVDGAKHAQLFKSVASVAEFIPLGFFGEAEVEALFYEAISGRAQDKKGALKTIQDAIKKGVQNPRRLPEPRAPKIVLLRSSAARAYIRGKSTEHAEAEGEDEPEAEGVDEDEKAVNNGIYAVLNGRTVLAVQKTKTKETGQDETGSRHFVCDWAAHIVGEVQDEEGQTIFDIEGKTVSGRLFKMSLQASKMSDSKYVAGQFLNVVGVDPVLFAGMEKHIVPAMRSFSDRSKARRIRRFNRVGWTRESEVDLSKREFIMPGMLAADVDVTGLDHHLAYRIDPPTTPGLTPEAATALNALILSQEPKHTLIALTTAFAAPLSLLCEWQGDKYAVFIAGRTGSFKTSFCQMILCLFGDFAREDTLIKFGLGTTANSLQAILTRASYVPMMVDNFKTNTGKGGQDAVGMIQAALEGGEKIRLNRNAEIRATKPIHAWMFLTGEDYVEDAASRARSLYLPFAYYGDTNENLSRVQELAHVLPQIGGHLLAWAMTDEALIVADYVKSIFGERRSYWAGFVRKCNKEAVNAYRVASNLAVCESAWTMLMGCPVLAPHLKPFESKFKEGLIECARSMAVLTAETHEATRYLDALRELIASDRAYLCERLAMPNADERRLKIGWIDDDGVYLISGVAFEAAVKAMASQGGLNSMSKNALHKQLAQLNHLAGNKKDQFTISIRVGGEGVPQTVLHLKRSSFFPDEQGNL
jgi:hypothetical protein